MDHQQTNKKKKNISRTCSAQENKLWEIKESARRDDEQNMRPHKSLCELEWKRYGELRNEQNATATKKKTKRKIRKRKGNRTNNKKQQILNGRGLNAQSLKEKTGRGLTHISSNAHLISALVNKISEADGACSISSMVASLRSSLALIAAQNSGIRAHLCIYIGVRLSRKSKFSKFTTVWPIKLKMMMTETAQTQNCIQLLKVLTCSWHIIESVWCTCCWRCLAIADHWWDCNRSEDMVAQIAYKKQLKRGNELLNASEILYDFLSSIRLQLAIKQKKKVIWNSDRITIRVIKIHTLTTLNTFFSPHLSVVIITAFDW